MSETLSLPTVHDLMLWTAGRLPLRLLYMTKKYVKEPVDFINVFQIYPNVFRQMVAIYKVS
jgi:hypothetical protein